MGELGGLKKCSLETCENCSQLRMTHLYIYKVLVTCDDYSTDFPDVGSSESFAVSVTLGVDSPTG